MSKEVEFIPFGDEWVKEMKQWGKPDLIGFLKDSLIVHRDLSIELKKEKERSAALILALEKVVDISFNKRVFGELKYNMAKLITETAEEALKQI